jgi:hypothetical protein
VTNANSLAGPFPLKGSAIFVSDLEVQMINDVVFEGIVTREPWKFTDDLFFRLANYRDTDLPPKPLDIERDQADYINIRVCGGANGLMSIRRGMRLRVHGFVQSRDYRESLSDFLEKAQKAGNTTQINLTEVKPEQITIERNVVEIVVRRIIVLDNGERK